MSFNGLEIVTTADAVNSTAVQVL